MSITSDIRRMNFFGKIFLFIASADLIFSIGAFQAPASLAQQLNPKTIKPASVKDLYVYFGIGATSLCSLLMQDIPFKPALTANTEAISSVLMGLHKGEIENGKKFENNELMLFSANQLILRSSDLCFDKLPAEVKESLKKFKSQGESKPKP